MNKTFKKILAIMLSVVISMPVILTYPFGANAKNDEDEYFSNHLVAQYFTDRELTVDMVGNNNLETVGTGASWNTSGVVNAAKFPGGNTGSKTNYYRVKVNNMLSTVTASSGLTVSFYAQRGGDDWQRYFEFSSRGGYGNGNDTSYLYFSCNGNSKIKNMSYGNSETGSPYINDDGAWHQWTITVKKGTIFVYRDGVYSGMTEDTSRIIESWFSNIKDGYLIIGASSYDSDPLFSGSISNFKVYDVALTSLQVRQEAYSKPGNHNNVNVRYETAVNFHESEGVGYAISNDSYYFSPQNSAYGLTRYSNEQSILWDDSLKYFRMWFSNDKLVYNDSSNTEEGVFRNEKDFRFDVTLGSRLDSSSEYLIGIFDRNGNIPIKLLRNGNVSVNNNEIGWIDSVHSGDNERFYNNYTFSFDYSEQILHFSCYGEYTDSSHNFAIEKDIKVTDYGLNLNPANLAGINILDGNGDGHTRFGGIFFYTPYSPVNNNLAGLKQAVATYEEKMKSGKIYTNSLEAYKAYVQANKYIDAAEYGNRIFTPDQYSDVALNLERATNNLKVWTPKRGTYHGRFSGDNDFVSDADYAKTYCNVLWSNDVSTDYEDAAIWEEEMAIYGGSEKCNVKLFHPSAVLLYDGENTPAIPVMSYFRHWCSAVHTYNISYSAIFLNSHGDQLELNEKWRNGAGGGVNESFNYQWHYLNNNGNEVNIVNYDTFDVSQHWGKHFSASMQFHFGFANQIRFKGSLADNEASRTLDNVNWGFNFFNNGNDLKRVRVNSGKPIYIINYKKLRDALSSSTSKTANIDKFKEGGMLEYFTALDGATAFDPQIAYDYSSDTASKVNQCADRINSFCNILNSSNYGKVDTYQVLRDEMKVSHDSPTGNSAETDYNTSNEELNKTYTAISISAFKRAYKDSVREMYLLVENGYSSAPASYNKLCEMHSGLDRLADFTALDAAKDKAIADSKNIDESLYTPSSVSSYREYLTSYFEFPYVYIGDRANTGVSKQAEVDAEAEKFANAQNIYLKVRSSLGYFDKTYNDAVEFLEGMAESAPQYMASDVNALIQELDSENVQKYANQSADDRAEYAQGGEEEQEANALADSIKADMLAMKNAESEIDISAYQQAVFVALDMEQDAYDYPKEELNRDLRIATSSISINIEYNGLTLKAIKDGAKQSIVNAVTSLIQSSLTTHIRTYSIQIIEGDVSDSDGVTFNGGTHSYDGTTDTYYATYNTTLNLKSDSYSAWYMEFESPSIARSIQYQKSSNRYSTKVIGNIKVYVYNSKDNYRVTVSRKYSDSDKEPKMLETFTKGEYTLPEAPAIAFYTFGGYTVGDNSYNPGDIINITKDTIIYANYNLSETLSCAVNIDGETGFTAGYNDKISLSGNDDTYAWLELDKKNNTFKPFYIGKDLTFFVTESITLKKVTEEEFISGKYKLPAINVRQNGAYITNADGVKKVVFNGQFVSDGSYEIAEYGILLGKANAEGDIEKSDVVLENIGVSDEYTLTRFKSTKNVGANQFTIGVKNLSGDAIYKGYIIYKLANGEFLTVYTDAISETL
ncbi:MAG: LamG domain-containing protein [Eubacterium sp.]|nr:LamG domain-containing protein [Eubacterium sp.]